MWKAPNIPRIVAAITKRQQMWEAAGVGHECGPLCSRPDIHTELRNYSQQVADLIAEELPYVAICLQNRGIEHGVATLFLPPEGEKH